MTTPVPVCMDDASAIVDAYVRAMKLVFSPTSECPPVGGGSTDVRFFAGMAPPTDAWDAHSDGGEGCDNPFLWVRIMRRYRSLNFPTPTASVEACSAPRVLAIEIGVGRCAVTDAEPEWTQYAHEAEVSLDDSWRIEKALCVAAGILRGDNRPVGIDTIEPYGPEGGIIGWTGAAYIQF